MRVYAQGEGRILVAEVLGQLLDRDAPRQHDAGVVVAELVNPFPAGDDITASAAPSTAGSGIRPALTSAGFQIVSE